MDLSTLVFDSLDRCKLRWRWTDPTYRLFSAEEIANIRPLSPGHALEAHQWAMKHSDDYALSSAHLRDLASMPAADSDAVKQWLFQLVPASESSVVVTWDDATAVLTNWQFFGSNWNDFCYPASDDVFVFPLNQAWLLYYMHDEHFEFGRVTAI